MTKLATWNMQGGSASTENKWNTGVRNLMTQYGLDLICLQECGQRPPSATEIMQVGPVYVYRWNRETLLYYPWDQGAHRCNLAIVIAMDPDEIDPNDVYILPDATWRPLLCYGAPGNGQSYVSMHAARYGGDVEDLLNAAQEFFGESGWIVAGDFNREPSKVASGPWNLCPPRTPTHPATNPTRRLDYAARGSEDDPVTGDVLNLQLSDHLPVVLTL